MAAIVYLHGFLSSPQSHKAQIFKAWLAEHEPDIAFHCPHLTPYPEQTRLELIALIQQLQLQSEPIWLIGSSLGGYWATWLAETYNFPAVLVNPATKPYELIRDYLFTELKGYHTDDCYRLEPIHMDELRAVQCEINHPQNYWLMVQTGDTTLDYKDAQEKYRACQQLIENGGDHSFVNFAHHFSNILKFYRSFASQTSCTQG